MESKKWICNKCGGEIKLYQETIYREEFSIDIEGCQNGEVENSSNFGVQNDYYMCNKCGEHDDNYFDIIGEYK